MSTCYYPDGNEAQGGDQPCGSGDAVMCCPKDWTCQDNGLCFLENQNYLGRYTCTDKSWKSDQCPQICTSDTGAGGDEAILDCSDGYCCDHNRPDAAGDSSLGCCETSTDRFQIENRQMVSGSGGGGGTSSSQSPSSIASSTAAPTSTDPPSSSVSSDTVESVSTASSSASSVTFPSTVSVATFGTSSSESQGAATSATNGNRNSSPTSSVDSPNNSESGKPQTSVILVTSVVTQAGGGSSTSVSSHTSVIAQAASTSSPTPSKKSNLGAIIGPAVAVPIALIALAVLAFFLWRRRKQKKNAYNSGDHAGYEPQDPVDMYAAQKPHIPEIDSPEMEKKSPNTTGPPSYRGVSGVPTVDSGDAHGLGLSSELPGSPAFPPGGEPQATQPSELEGNTYRPYRPPRT